MANGWTKTPNEILEMLASIEGISTVEIKLTLALVRQTFGWQRNQVRLRWEDIARLTSIKGRASISKAIEAVESRGWFIHGRKSIWSINSSNFELFENENSSKSEPYFLNYSTEIELFENENSSKNEPFEVEESSKSEPSSYKEKKKEEKEREEKNPLPLPPAANGIGISDEAIMPAFPEPEWFRYKGITPPADDAEWAKVRHPAVKTWMTVTGRWPGYAGLDYIISKMGIRPSANALRNVWTVWQVNEYNPANITGILDRYSQEIKEKPVSGDLSGRVFIPAELEGIVRR